MATSVSLTLSLLLLLSLVSSEQGGQQQDEQQNDKHRGECASLHYVYSSADSDSQNSTSLLPPWPSRFTNPLDSPHSLLDMTIYGAEQRVYLQALSNVCRTLDPSEAHFFFVPIFSSILIHKDLYEDPAATANLQAAYDFIDQAHHLLLNTSPYYSKNNGTDHIFVQAHDIGGCLAPTHVARSSIILQHYGQESNEDAKKYLENSTAEVLWNRVREGVPCFQEGKDIQIPPFIGER